MWPVIAVIAVAALGWWFNRRRDSAQSHRDQAAGDASYADMAEKAWKESAKLREALALAEAAQSRAEEGRRKDRAVTTRRFELIAPLLEQCLSSHPEYEADFAEFKALQWTEGLNGGAG